MTTVALVLAGIVGLAVGSFLNVVVHRLPRGESLLWPASHCPTCDAVIKARHNIPVLSWLLLRGRCAYCGIRISYRYPLVEAGTAVLFVAVTARLGVTGALPAFLYLAAIAVPLALIDIKAMRLPDAIVLPSYAVAGLLLALAALVDGEWAAVLHALAGAGALWVFYFALAYLIPGGMGFGDVKLAGLLGLYLGWLGWRSVLVGTFAAFLLGGLVGVSLLLIRPRPPARPGGCPPPGRAGRRTAIPFGPHMLAGALLALFAAEPITDWYGSLFSPAA